jgi:CRISPR-associated exonuclease Cas4
MITGTVFGYYHYCIKKMWLFNNGITMEHTSDIVLDGKINHETTKNRRQKKYKEISFGNIKIDFYDVKNNTIYETKRNFKNKNIDEWQLKYYMYIFFKNENINIKGILEYPKSKKLYEITLDDKVIKTIDDDIIEINKILKNDNCPNVSITKKCKNCSYLNFCES